MASAGAPVSWFSRASWRAAYQAEAPIWLYAGKVILALYLACWLTMRFNLGQPSTTMTTVMILMHPNSGMVLAKAFFRALGTMVGSVFCVVLVAVFSQEPDVLLFFVSVWLGLCAAGSMLYRGFAAYAFVLSGYTVMIVLIPIIHDPSQVFDSAVRRVSEVMLGILITTCVSDLVFPQRMAGALIQQLRGQTASLLDFLRSSLFGPSGGVDPKDRHLQIVRQVMQVENLRSTVIFERGDMLARSGLINQLNLEFLKVSSTLEAIQHLSDELNIERDARLLVPVTELYDAFGAALSSGEAQTVDLERLRRGLDECLAQWPARVAQLRAPLVNAGDAPELLRFDTIEALLRRLADEIKQYLGSLQAIRRAKLESTSSKLQFSRSNDLLDAAVTGLRAFVSISLCGTFWLSSGWDSGSGMMLMGGIACSLLAAVPNADKVAWKLLHGLLFGAFGAFIICFAFLPLSSGFTQLVTISLPFFLLVPLLASRPAFALVGMGLGVSVSFLTPFNKTVSNSAAFAVDSFLDNVAAQVLGILVATFVFTLMPSFKTAVRQRKKLSRQVIFALEAPLDGLAVRFLSRSSDLVDQIVGPATKAEDVQDLLTLSLDVQFLGRIIIELRQNLQLTPAGWPWRSQVADFLSRLSEQWQRPEEQGLRSIMASLETMLMQLREQDAGGEGPVPRLLLDLCMLKSALTDERLALITGFKGSKGGADAA